MLNCKEVSTWWQLFGEREGLAGVFLRNVDKEFLQESKQNSGQGFMRCVDMIINVRQRGM